MAYLATAQSAIEPVSADSWKIVANKAAYAVVSGCGITYNAGNMTVNVAAGTIIHNGSLVAVAAQASAITLVADGSNPTWAWIGVNSGGTVVLVTGTPAANPAVPSLGNNVALALVKVETGQTIANNITYKLNHSIQANLFAGSSMTTITAAGTLPVVNQYHQVTGITTITALPNFTAGTVVVLNFLSATPITHNGTSLILAAGGPIVVSVGDTLTFVSEGSGNWRQVAPPSAFIRVASQNAALTTTATVSTTLYTSPTLSIPVTMGIRIRGNFRKTATNANAVALGLTLNATVVFTAAIASQAGIAVSSASNQAEDGSFEVIINPRSSANYLNGVSRTSVSRVSATGAIATSLTNAQGNLAAPVPNATITSILITGINDTANNNVEVFNVTIDVMPN